MRKKIEKNNKIQWWEQIPENSLWYLVGLVASDGCLSGDERHIDITAKERSFLSLLKRSCNIPNRITPKKNGRGSLAYHIQIGSVSFYDFLSGVGLMPNKSKKLGPLCVPENFYPHFLRGVIDGDGSIRRWKHPTNGGEQWSLRICGASRPFMEWLQNSTSLNIGALGRLHKDGCDESVKWVLKYGKIAAQRVFEECYCKGAVSLARKTLMVRKCGESKRGWSRSKTVVENCPGGGTGRRKGL